MTRDPLPNRAPRHWRAFFVTALTLLELAGGRLAFARPGTPVFEAVPLTCAKALENLQNDIGIAVGEDHWSLFNPIRPTVREIGSREGLHGGRIVTLKRTGRRWASRHATVEYDPQGDPRYFVTMVGAEAARFFGYRIIDDLRLEVPDQAEFTGALAAINQILKLRNDEIPITFYTTVDNTNVKTSVYVRRFRDEGGIPLAHSGNHLIHDLSFHTAAIFLPPEAVRLKRLEIKFMEGFIDWMTPKVASDEARAKALRFYASILRMEQTILIDNATGLLAPLIVAYLKTPNEAQWQRHISIPVQYLTADGQRPDEALLKMLRALGGLSMYGVRSLNAPVDKSKLAKHLAALPMAEVIAHLNKFDLLFDPLEKMTPRWQAVKSEQAVEALCRELNARRLLIRDLALRLLPNYGDAPPPMPLPEARPWWEPLRSLLPFG